MQDDLAANFPLLDIQIIGVNEEGEESANGTITSGRDLAWLQDVDSDTNGMSDVWESWGVTFRDVYIVDANNAQVGVYNLTNNDLANSTNYNTLRQMFIDAATTPELNVADTSITEGDLGTSTLTFTITLSAASSQTVTVDYATADGTALANSDYVARTGSVTFAPGVTSRTVAITILDDTTFEADETFTLTLNNAVGATIGDGVATGTLTNNDDPPTVDIADFTVVEGNSGTTQAIATVSLSNASTQTITVDVATADGTATVADGDYVAMMQTVTFAPGETSKTVSITVNGDTLDEPNEMFDLILSNATNATAAVDPARVTIADDDLAGALSIDNVTVTEGDSGTVTATFTVTLSSTGVQPVMVDFAAAAGSATSADFQAAGGTLTFNAGETTKTVTVLVNGDLLDEEDETFTVDLSNAVNASIAVDQGTGTITDDDDPPSVSVGDVTVTEGDGGTVEASVIVTLSAASGRTVTVDYQTRDGTAVAPGDYQPAGGVVTFQPGETSKTITVAIVGDTVNEPSETVHVMLISAMHATLADTEGDIIITDEDLPGVIQFSQAQYNVDEDAGVVTITVTRTGGDAGGVTVDFATGDDSALAGSDYTATSGTLTFAGGETSKTFQVPIQFDDEEESAETLTLTLSNPGGGATLGSTATGTVVIADVAHDPVQRSITDRYRGFLNREPETAGMQFYQDQLSSGQMTPLTMALAIQNSPEYRTNYITNLYDELLGRDPAGGVAIHMRALDAGASHEQLRARFLGSAEYFARQGGTNDGFLAGLFQDVLGRAIGPVGVETFQGALRDGMSREDVALAVINSAEGRGRAVGQLYSDLLGRQGSQGEIDFHVNHLNRGLTGKQLAAHFAASDEYFAQF